MDRIRRFVEHLARPENLLRLPFEREPKLAFEHITKHEAGMAMRI
jgi:hypothetical protein